MGSAGKGVTLIDPRDQFGVDLPRSVQNDLVVPSLGGYTLCAVDPGRLKPPVQNDINQDSSASGMDTEKSASVCHVER